MATHQAERYKKNIIHHGQADSNGMWFISVKLVVLANTTDNQKPTTEILYLGIMCVVDFGCGDAFDTT